MDFQGAREKINQGRRFYLREDWPSNNLLRRKIFPGAILFAGVMNGQKTRER
jgi:hypothetical protein